MKFWCVWWTWQAKDFFLAQQAYFAISTGSLWEHRKDYIIVLFQDKIIEMFWHREDWRNPAGWCFKVPLWHEYSLLIWLDINITARLSDMIAQWTFSRLSGHISSHLTPAASTRHGHNPTYSFKVPSTLYRLYIYYSTGKSYGWSHWGQNKTNNVASETSLRGFSWDFWSQTPF